MFIEFTIKRTKSPAQDDGPHQDLLIEAHDPTDEGAERAEVRLTQDDQETTFVVSARSHVTVTPAEPLAG